MLDTLIALALVVSAFLFLTTVGRHGCKGSDRTAELIRLKLERMEASRIETVRGETADEPAYAGA